MGRPERSNSCSDHRAAAVANHANSWASSPLAAILSSRSRIARTRARRFTVKASPAGAPVSSGARARLALRSVSAASRSTFRFRAATDRAAISLELAVSNRGMTHFQIPLSPRQARPWNNRGPFPPASLGPRGAFRRAATSQKPCAAIWDSQTHLGRRRAPPHPPPPGRGRARRLRGAVHRAGERRTPAPPSGQCAPTVTSPAPGHHGAAALALCHARRDRPLCRGHGSACPRPWGKVRHCIIPGHAAAQPSGQCRQMP